MKQLEYFIATVKAGSISAAAQRLHVSRQAVSVGLKSLEEELGCSLFLKGNQGVELTRRGIFVFEKAKKALMLIDDIMKEKNTEIVSSFFICTTPLVSLYLTNNLFISFRKLHPYINIFIRNSLLANIIDDLNKFSHIAVVRTVVNSKISEKILQLGGNAVTLYTDQERIFISSEHPLAEKDTLTADDLKYLYLALYSSGQQHIAKRYAQYFAGIYYMANRTDLQTLAMRNEAVVICPARLFSHDSLVEKGYLVEREIPLPHMDTASPVIALSMPDLTSAEQLFWDYLVENFKRHIL